MLNGIYIDPSRRVHSKRRPDNSVTSPWVNLVIGDEGGCWGRWVEIENAYLIGIHESVTAALFAYPQRKQAMPHWPLRGRSSEPALISNTGNPVIERSFLIPEIL